MRLYPDLFDLTTKLGHSMSITWGWHVVLLSQEEGGQGDAKIKEEGRHELAARMILKAMLDAQDKC